MRPTLILARRSSPARPSQLLARLLDRLLDADARYRDNCRLLEMPEERLRDMGLVRPRTAMRSPALRSDWS